MSKIEEFESILKNDTKYKIIQVSAKWCKPCNIIKPLINNYLSEITIKIEYIKLDYDEINELPEFEKYFQLIPGGVSQDVDPLQTDGACKRIQVKKLPYFVLYKDNIKIEEFSSSDFNSIKNKFNEFFNDFQINNDF
jgi:thiol-disulfide isomerase/thioredoxin